MAASAFERWLVCATIRYLLGKPVRKVALIDTGKVLEKRNFKTIYDESRS